MVDRRSGELAGVPTTRQEARQGVGEQCQAGTGREDVCVYVCMCVYVCCAVLCVAIFCVRGVGASVLCTMRQAGCLVWESAVIRAARRSGPTCICWHWHWHGWETKEPWNSRTAIQAACRAGVGAWPRTCVLIGQPSHSVPHLLVAVIVEYLIRQQVPTPEASHDAGGSPVCLPCPGPWRAASVIPAANVILCNARCQRREAVIPCALLVSLQTKEPSSRPLWYTHAPARHCSETSRDLSARSLVRPSDPPCVPSPNSDWSYQLRGVAMCRYQPRSDLRYAQASFGKEHTSQSSNHKTEHAEHPAGRAHCRARKTGGFHTCAHLSLPSHQHVACKWTVFDVRISATVHVDYTSPMIRRCNVLGDGLACVSLPFLHTTLGEYRDLQI